MPAKNQSVIYLIIVNVVIFLLSEFFPTAGFSSLALYFPLNDNFEIWQIFTQMFMHGSVAHILFNMYGLYLFGTALEKTWGTRRFLSYYFVTGIGAAVIYTLANYYQFTVISNEIMALGYDSSQIKALVTQGTVDQNLFNALGKERLMEFISIYQTPAVGASGALYGVLVAFAMMYPNAKLMLIFLPVPISAKYFVPIILLGDLFFGVTKYSVGNIAHFAHIGGALTGLLIMLVVRHQIKKKQVMR